MRNVLLDRIDDLGPLPSSASPAHTNRSDGSPFNGKDFLLTSGQIANPIGTSKTLSENQMKKLDTFYHLQVRINYEYFLKRLAKAQADGDDQAQADAQMLLDEYVEALKKLEGATTQAELDDAYKAIKDVNDKIGFF